MKEICHVTGEAYGGINVDQNFQKLLENLFGIPEVKAYRMKFPAEWLRLMNDFEIKKRGRRAFDDKITRITLPRNFLQMVSGPGTSDLATRLAKSCNLDDVEIYNDEYLCLGPKAMKSLFDPVVNGIIRHMRELLSKPALKNVSGLFMVGGFAESVILQEAIKTTFSSRCRVLVPNYASIAVVQGATIFGQKPTVVSARVMATTFGFKSYAQFEPKVHPNEKKVMNGGITWCKEVFQVIAKENETVSIGEKKRFTRRPMYSDQKSASFLFFTSTDPNVKYTTDSSVGPSIGNVQVDSPDTSKGTNRNFELSIFFGGTEIKATAIDLTSSNAATVYLDFLTKS